MEITDLVYHPKAEKNLSMLEFKTIQGLISNLMGMPFNWDLAGAEGMDTIF